MKFATICTISLAASAMLCTASPVETLQVFKADVKDQFRVKQGGTTIDTEMTGTFYVDSNLQRTRIDFKTLKMNIKSGDPAADSNTFRRLLSETPERQTPGASFAHNRALMQSSSSSTSTTTTSSTSTTSSSSSTSSSSTGSTTTTETSSGDTSSGGGMEMSGDGMDISIDLKGGGTELLRYDLGKNFTWFTEGGKTECTCDDLEGELEPFYVDPLATKGTSGTIKINGADVTVDKYTSKVDVGISLEMTYYVEAAKKHLRKLVTKASGEGLNLDTFFELWGISTTIDNKDWEPHASCTCPTDEPVKINVAPASAYVAADKCSAKTGCKCIPTDATGNDALTFCKDIVTYPVRKTIFAKSKDDFVKSAYDGHIKVIGSKTDDCKKDLKDFLCKFYFQTCFEDGVVKAPPELLGDCAKGLSDTEELKGYSQAKFLSAGNSADGSTTFSAADGLIASPFLATVLTAMAMFKLA